MWDLFAPRLRRAVFAALDEAGRRGQTEATAGDLLAVVLNDDDSAAAYIIEHAGLSPDRVLRDMRPTMQPAAGRQHRAGRLSAGALHVLDVAVAEGRRLDDNHVGTEHVLLAFTLARHVTETENLSHLGLTHQRVLEGRAAWSQNKMPRRRSRSLASLGRLSHWLLPVAVRRALAKPLARLGRLPLLAYRVYVRHSLAHPRFVTNPYPLYRALRDRDPVRRDPLFPVWVVTRYADVMTILRDPRFCRDPFTTDRMPETPRDQLDIPPDNADDSPGPIGLISRQMLFLDPPNHTRIRSVFSKAFAGRALQGLRPRIQQITDARLEQVRRSGGCDLIRDLAYPLPTVVIAELLGFPPEDYERIKKGSDDFAATLALNPSGPDQERAGRSINEIRDYFQQVVMDILRGRHSQDCLLAELLQAGARGEGLGPEDLFANCVLLLTAGHETTTNLIGNGMLALLRHRDQWDALRADPGLISGTVEELLRYDSPVQWTSRVAAEDLTLGGKLIERDQFILAGLGAANRDPAQFPDPDRLDIRRADNKHLAFGQGIHFCLGATLARLEAEIAIGSLAAMFPTLTLAARKLKWHKGLTFRGIASLPLKF